MTRRLTISVILMFLLAGCRHDIRPDYVMDTSTFRAFLVDAYLIESYDNIVVSQHRDSLQDRTRQALDTLMARYGINADTYDSTLCYYLNHPKQLQEIHTRVVDQLNRTRDALPATAVPQSDTLQQADTLNSKKPSHISSIKPGTTP